jgi:4-hydroxy-tetrahydrodipicolinate synthase
MSTSSMQLRPEGTWTAIVTPFVDDTARSLDLEGLSRIVEQQIEGSIDGIVVCGTTGEAATLTHDEYVAVVGHCVRAAGGRVPVIAGTGSNDTARTIAMTRVARELGVDGALIVTPYYNKPTQDGIIAHYRAVLDAVSIPTMLYNVPGRTATNMTAETVAALGEHPDVVAVKEAAGSLDQVQAILRLTEGALPVLSGDDVLNVSMYAVGGHGAVSVASNVAPALTAGVYRKHRAGDTAGAAADQLALHPLVGALFCESNPQPVKMGMHLLGLCAPVTRLPLQTASATATERMRAAMRALDLPLAA